MILPKTATDHYLTAINYPQTNPLIIWQFDDSIDMSLVTLQMYTPIAITNNQFLVDLTQMIINPFFIGTNRIHSGDNGMSFDMDGFGLFLPDETQLGDVV